MKQEGKMRYEKKVFQNTDAIFYVGGFIGGLPGGAGGVKG